MKSAIGLHTTNISQGLKMEEEFSLNSAFYDYMRKGGQITKEPIKNKKGQVIGLEYAYKKDHSTGIRWKVFNIEGKNNLRIYRVQAIINPKVLLSKDKDYIGITTESDIHEIKDAFNNVARKISPILGSFDSYSISRVDYCGNFYLEELKIPCTPERMMKLIKMGDIPAHYVEWTKYDNTSRRKKTNPSSFYLVSGSVVVNCYDKGAQLKNDEKHPCQNKEDAEDLIRFEIQYKNRKLHAMWKNYMCVSLEPEPSIPTFSNEEEMDEFYRELMTRQRPALPIEPFLSNAICVEVIDKYFRKILRSGDYYTLEKARDIIKMCRFRPKREEKLIKALKMTNDHRGIYKTKLRLMGKDLLEYNRMLNDLDELGINPVTIPRHWGIEHIPNLLNAYYNKCADVQNDKRRREWERKLLMS